MYKKAMQINLRLPTIKGALSTEQCFGLTESDLKDSIKNVNKTLKKTEDSDELSFLETNVVVDTINKLRFDILKDIYITKRNERIAITEVAEIKAHNQKIYEKMAANEDKKLDNMSNKELEKQLK